MNIEGSSAGCESTTTDGPWVGWVYGKERRGSAPGFVGSFMYVGADPHPLGGVWGGGVLRGVCTRTSSRVRQSLEKGQRRVSKS